MKNYSNSNRSLIFLVVIILLLLGLVVGLVVQLLSDSVPNNLKNTDIVKALVVINDGDGNALATDVIACYPVSNRGVIFNILGNTGALYTSLSGASNQEGRVDRIDKVYKERGIEVYADEVTRLLGIDLPFTLEIELPRFGDLTDLFGGLTVSVFSQVEEESANGDLWLLPSGNAKLDGDKIQTFMSYELSDDGINDKDNRRQDAVKAFFSAMHENRAMMMNKKNFPTFAKLFKTNVDNDSLFTLLGYLSNIDTENMDQRGISGSPRSIDGQILVFPYENGRQIKDVVRRALSSLISDDLNSRVYVVEVLNGTDKQGAASNACFLFQNFGYETMPPADAPTKGYQHTVIINHIGNADAVGNLAEIITCKNIIDEEVKSSSSGYTGADVDFTIILGNDWDGRYVRGGYTGEE